MREHKQQRFHVLELKSKVKTLEAMFGDKLMRSQLNPRTVDKWLKDSEPTPYLTSLKKYFGVIGMKESDMIKPMGAFAECAAQLYSRRHTTSQVQYSDEDVVAIYNSFNEVGGAGNQLLGHTLKMIQIETVKNDYNYLNGYYHMYHFWNSGDASDSGKVRRNLIHIHDLDMRRGLINCRIMIAPMKGQREEDWWVYEGWIVNIKSKLLCLCECVQGMAPEVVTLNIFKPSFWPAPDHFFLQGILVALSLQGVPCASNILLVKIDPNDPFRDKIGYFSHSEIGMEGRQIDILEYIDNKITENSAVLTPKAVDK